MKSENMIKEHQSIFNFLLAKLSMTDKKLLIKLVELEHQLTKEES